MGLGVNGILPPLREQFINFDSTDLITGKGFITFDGIGNLKTATEYFLLRSDAITQVVTTDDNPNGTGTITLSNVVSYDSSTKLLDLDFDTEFFVSSRTIEGEGMVRVPFYFSEQSAGNFAHHVVAILKKWDGSTETQINTVTSQMVTTNASGEWSHLMMMTLPKTLIKKGEQLRLTIEAWGNRTGGAGTFQLQLGHNPSDKTTQGTLSAGNSRLILAIPFNIEV